MRRVALIVVMSMLTRGGSLAWADEPAPAANGKKSESKTLAETTPAAAAPVDTANDLSEADILAFAREHHPELADLLTNLKQMNAAEYQKALRQLDQARQRLSRLRKNSPEKYETALAGWKLDSRIRLLAARMTMSDEPALEEQLKQLLRDRQDVRIKELTVEKNQLAERLGKTEKALQTLEADREKLLQKELDRIKKGLGKGRVKGAAGKSAAEKTKGGAKKTGDKSEGVNQDGAKAGKTAPPGKS